MPLTAAAAHPLLRRERRATLVRALLLSAGGAATAYALYRLYRSDALQSTARSLRRLRAALAAYADACGTGADTLRLVLADLHAFLQSDRRELPPSLRQLARLMQAPEVADTTSATVAALWRGVAGGASAAASSSSQDGTHPALDGSSSGFAHAHAPGTHKPALDRVLEALLSERGHSLVSVAVSLGARNMVSGFCEVRHRLAAADRAAAGLGPQLPGSQPDLTNRLLDFLGTARGQQLAVLCVSAFVTGGMRAYLDQTLDVNFYEDLFSAMARPEHLEAVKAVVGVFARDVVGTYLAGPSQQPQALAAPGAAAAEQQQQPTLGIRLSASIQELMNRAGSSRQQQQQGEQQQQQHEERAGEEHEAPADTGSPCGSSASGGWQQAAAGAEAAPPAAASDVDSDVLLLHPQVAAKGGETARSVDSWAVRTPPAAAEAAGGRLPAAALPALRRVQAEEVPAGMRRTGSGNLEWISAVGKEWLNVVQNPQGRTVMVELAGAAAKEAAAGVSAALADRFRLEWMLLAALAMLLMAWLLQRLMAALLG
ncbi:PHLOEM PROTEIN 2-LIKE A10 [Chlorella sorokiniana]|uniref:PHLOEM PROTEIN 2-LIKE A10 n=1 Tax=Chlorella sorokiniana TaxID=3076 RepID=A0A2P6TLU7_CHLSO|nr:PHLOEM PROTEIN 2-LIKE A10 [Chlorella sorokiniana]|eukprot:PRW45258.1 PHLOEM PROTEIN 2-LIKE A10 [Chlorella sorokiniana]